MSIRINKVSVNISGGPNKDALFDSCKYACHGQSKIPLSFGAYVDGTSVVKTLNNVTITAIEHENGSGESFILRGFVKVFVHAFGGEGTYPFEGYYNARTRKGRFSISN